MLFRPMLGQRYTILDSSRGSSCPTNHPFTTERLAVCPSVSVRALHRPQGQRSRRSSVGPQATTLWTV